MTELDRGIDKKVMKAHEGELPKKAGVEPDSGEIKNRAFSNERHQKAQELDSKIKWLVNNVPDLKQDQIIAELGGEPMRKRIMSRIYKLGRAGFLERRATYKTVNNKRVPEIKVIRKIPKEVK